MNRTHTCGELRKSAVGESVRLIGWVGKRRNLGSLVFIDLRDRYGYTQVLIKNVNETIATIRSEFILAVEGIVQVREQANPKLPTGEIEVIATEVTIINQAELPPFIIADETDALEDTRLKYRYLDLRRPIQQRFLIMRSQICKSVRSYLDDLDFIEVETPILTLSTPEGARDYLVPSRVKQGAFYALPQSPQLFKQLLMVGGFEKYYQIARCFRDEDLRADRQPDFTQIDIETSFYSQDELFTLFEGLVHKMFADVVQYETPKTFIRLPYLEALDRYGSDKPDTRFAMELQDVGFLKSVNHEAFATSATIKALVVPSIAHYSRKQFDELNGITAKYGIKSVIVLKMTEQGLEGSFLKFFNDAQISALIQTLKPQVGDAILIANGAYRRVISALGALRLHFGRTLNLIDTTRHDFLWIIDFPLFQYDEEAGRYESEHHPFTRPRDEDLAFLETDPLKVYGYCYDLVIDGYETLSGSLRIYDQKVQEKIFTILGFSKEDIQRKFGFFVDALKYGTPPHGGGAFGLDRLTMILTGTDNIRDVIAFPKNLSATCPMSNAPMPVDQQQLQDLGIQVASKETA